MDCSQDYPPQRFSHEHHLPHSQFRRAPSREKFCGNKGGTLGLRASRRGRGDGRPDSCRTGSTVPIAIHRQGGGNVRIPACGVAGKAASCAGQRGGGEDSGGNGRGRPDRTVGRIADPGLCPAGGFPLPGRAIGGAEAARLSRRQHRPLDDFRISHNPRRVDGEASARSHPPTRQ